MCSESREQVEDNRERWRSVLQRTFKVGQSTCVVWFGDRDTEEETGGRAGGRRDECAEVEAEVHQGKSWT